MKIMYKYGGTQEQTFGGITFKKGVPVEVSTKLGNLLLKRKFIKFTKVKAKKKVEDKTWHSN